MPASAPSMAMRALRPKATFMPPLAARPSATRRSVSGKVSPRPSASITRLRALRSAMCWSGASAAAALPPSRWRKAWPQSARQRTSAALKSAKAAAGSHSRRTARCAGVSCATLWARRWRRSASAQRGSPSGSTRLSCSENGSVDNAARRMAPCWWASAGSGRRRMCSTRCSGRSASSRPSRRARRCCRPAGAALSSSVLSASTSAPRPRRKDNRG